MSSLELGYMLNLVSRDLRTRPVEMSYGASSHDLRDSVGHISRVYMCI